MEVDSSVKRANDLNLEEVSSATQQKRVKTVFKTLWDDTNSEKPFQLIKFVAFRLIHGIGFHALSRAFWTKIN